MAVALPRIDQSFNASLQAVQWSVTAYVLAFAAFLIPAGRLADSLASVPSVFGSVITPLDTGVLTGEHVSERVEATIQQMAEETGGVVVGRAAVCVLRAHPNVMIGSLETVVEMLYSRRESLGVNYVTVQQSQIESFAPVVDRLCGR